VGDDEDTSLKDLEGFNERSERLTIEVVGRFVKADDVGTTPGGSTEDDLDLLTTRETPHGVVGDKLRLETEICEVLLDLATNEGAEETKALSLTSVDLKDFL
jgi:hypothetical protein